MIRFAPLSMSLGACLLYATFASADPSAIHSGARPPLPQSTPAAKPRQSFNDLVRGLVAAGEVRPLRDVLEAVRKASPGEIVSIKLRRLKAGWVYHLRVVKQGGRRAELVIDGKSLKIIERK